MLVILLVRLAVLAVAIALTAALLPDITVDGGPLTYTWIAVLFAVVNATLGFVLRIVTLPLRLLTLGLSSLLVNGLLLWVTSWISDDLEVKGFLTAVLGAVVISVVSLLIHALLPDRDR